MAAQERHQGQQRQQPGTVVCWLWTAVAVRRQGRALWVHRQALEEAGGKKESGKRQQQLLQQTVAELAFAVPALALQYSAQRPWRLG